MKARMAHVFLGCCFCIKVVALPDTVLERMQTCMAKPLDADRLACYDAQIGRSKPGQNEDLGMSGELLRQQQRQAGVIPAPPQDMTAKVAAIATPRFGNFIVTLDDGQVWAQAESADFPLKVGDLVTIRRGLLGSLRMSVANRNANTLVRRIK